MSEIKDRRKKNIFVEGDRRNKRSIVFANWRDNLSPSKLRELEGDYDVDFKTLEEKQKKLEKKFQEKQHEKTKMKLKKGIDKLLEFSGEEISRIDENAQPKKMKEIEEIRATQREFERQKQILIEREEEKKEREKSEEEEIRKEKYEKAQLKFHKGVDKLLNAKP